MEAFGMGPRLAPVGARLLPIAELAVSAALIPAATARLGAVAAIALLMIFSVAIARTLRAGSAPDCNCFGGLTQTEVGRGTLIRNFGPIRPARRPARSATTALATPPAREGRTRPQVTRAGLAAWIEENTFR